MKHLLIVLLFTVVCCLLAFVPKAEDPIDRLVSSLQKWVDKNPQEKVYLHMDKPYYALGDTVWFKAYVTIGSRHQLSKMSGALYVELIDEKDSLLHSVKLPLTAGMALGDFTLGDAYQAGNFRIRAYTQWMRNAGEEYFFDKSFVVGDPLGIAAAEGLKGRGKQDGAKNINDPKTQLDSKGQPLALSISDVQFFPEGGSLVNGINSRIGFKAVAASGRGIAIKGVVTDNAGVEVSNFETLHAGMGVFNFRPEAGKTYRAKVTFSDGSEKLIDLPKALEQGYVLSVYQPGPDSVLVRINASPAQYQIPYAVDLMVHSGGEMVSATTVKINKAVNSVWLMKKDFPSGIAQFTLFDGRGEAVNERIAFVRAKDRMQLTLSSAKKSYKSRERVELDMEARDKSGKPVAGNFSVSVIDESKTPAEENAETTIFSSMLLSSDIKGYIEEPNYYFRKDTAEVNKALDNLMLTQGYRRFVWKDILSTTSAGGNSRYPAESLGTEISGRVLTLSGKPVVNGQVTVMSLTPGFMEQVKTDADGRFKYQPIMLADSLRFAVQARTEKNSNKVEVILDSIPRQVIGKNWNIPGFTANIEESTKAYLENSRKQDDLLVRTGGQGRSKRLKEVVIKAQKGESIQYASQGSLRIPEGSADQTFIMKDAGNCASLNVCLVGRLVGVISDTITIQRIPYDNYPYMSYGEKKAPLDIILNGRKLDKLEIVSFWTGSMVDAEDIVKIDVVRTNQALIAYVGKSILVYTRREKKAKYNPSITNIKPKGFNKAREFYAPRYDRPDISHQLPDLRSTIYWNPKLKTDSVGKGSFSFFNADGPGSYKVVVEGINAAGELARQVYQYEVTAGPQAQLADLPSGNTGELVKAMQNLQQSRSAEKLYLHTDKPYYNLGDTIWFKAYLFDAASLSASKKSGLLYVELNDDTAETVRRISIPLKDGVGYAQIPLNRKIFHEGGYTLRAYTNWMQNFGADYFFTQRFYLGVPTKDTWLVKSSSRINKVADQDQLQAELVFGRSDQSAAALREVEVRIMEGAKQLYKEKMQTNSDGKLDLKYELKEKADGRNIKAEIRSLHPGDHNQLLLVPLHANRDQRIDLQFLPEGGNLVAGLKSLIGFKALSEDGRGVHVSGEIYDSKGGLAGSFSSLYNGMGSFNFTPHSGETYTAKLKVPEVADKTFDLPKVKPDGTVLHVGNEAQSDSLVLLISGTAAAFNPDSTYYLMATSRGLVTYARTIDLKKRNFSILKSVFPSGITKFTLLRNKTPLNERMVFVDQKDNMRIALTADKTAYAKRDSVAVLLEVKDKNGNPLKGNFSLSVTDNSQVKPDTLSDQGIAATLLINADLKGTVETPGYYLNRQNKVSWQALDNLMLTQGWVGYDWAQAFSGPKPMLFAAEKHFKVNGKVNNLSGKPVAGAQILISSQKPFFITNTITDDHGSYVFENLPQIDSGSFFIQAKTPKGKTMNFGEVTVDRFKAAAVPERLRDQILPWYVNTDVAQLNYVKRVALKAEESSLRPGGIALKEVKITDKKIIKGSFNRNGPGNADLVFDEQDIKESGVMSLYDLLKQKLPGIRINQQDGFATLKLNAYMVVISIDGGGLPIHISDTTSTQQLFDELNEVKIANFKGMEVMYSRKYTSGTYEFPQQVIAMPTASKIADTNMKALMVGRSAVRWPYYKTGYTERYLDARANFLSATVREIAVIEITTGNKHGWQVIRKPDIATLRPLPVMRPLEFYSPEYTLKSADNAEPDFRSTIYWKPDLQTDGQGKARVVFYTSDVAGSYTLNLQGSDMDGNIGSAVSVIKVP